MFWARAMYWGHASARDNFALQLGNLALQAYESLGDTPVIIGECGIPMDMKSVSLSLLRNMRVAPSADIRLFDQP